jgi:hypothetical protein
MILMGTHRGAACAPGERNKNRHKADQRRHVVQQARGVLYAACCTLRLCAHCTLHVVACMTCAPEEPSRHRWASDANKGTDNANKGTDNGNKGTDNGNKGTDNANKGHEVRSRRAE